MTDTVLSQLWRSFSWRRYFGVWTILLVPSALYYAVLEDNGSRTLAQLAIYNYTAAILCLLAFVVAWRFPLTRQRLVPHSLAYVGFICFAIAFNETIAVELYTLFDLTDHKPVNRALVSGARELMIIIVANMLIAGNAVAASARAHSRDKAIQRLKSALSEQYLAAVTAALDPEDAFTSLDKIRVLLRHDPEGALDEIAELANRLRTRLNRQHQRIPTSTPGSVAGQRSGA